MGMMKVAASSIIRNLSCRASAAPLRSFSRNALHHASPGRMKILGMLYRGHEHASMNPNMLGCAEAGLGLRDWMERKNHQYVVTHDDAEMEKHLADAEVMIMSPYQNMYMTPEMMKKAKNLRLVITTGHASDHMDLKAAASHGLTVAEAYSNAGSAAEDMLMRMLVLSHNFVPAYHQAVNGECDVGKIAHRAHDLEGKTVGMVGAGRVNKHLMRMLQPFKCNQLYHDQMEMRMDPMMESQLGAKYMENLDSMLPMCDIVAINMPLTEMTRGMFDRERIRRMKKGAMVVNNSSGAMMDTQAVADACASGHLAGYGGDGWHPPVAPKNHPWRSMPNHAMTPRMAGNTIDGQMRYAADVKDMLEMYSRGEELPDEYCIVRMGKKQQRPRNEWEEM